MLFRSGENYNEAADDYLDIQKRRFQNTDNVDQWKYILNNTDDYTPYYDTQKELMDLVSKFKPNSIEADQAGGGRIVTTKDQSVYASTLQDFLEANLSDKYKAQKDLEAKVNFGKQQLLSYNPTIVNTPKYQGGNMIWSGTKVNIAPIPAKTAPATSAPATSAPTTSAPTTSAPTTSAPTKIGRAHV